MTEKLKIEGEGITLTQALKLSGLAESGGHAKTLIGEGLVRVNGRVELRKKCQLVISDVIEVENGGKVILT